MVNSGVNVAKKSQKVTRSYFLHPLLEPHTVTHLYICNCLHHANWHEPNERDDEGKNECPPTHFGGISIDCGEGKSDTDNKQRNEPPGRYFGILVHHLLVDITHLVA